MSTHLLVLSLGLLLHGAIASATEPTARSTPAAQSVAKAASASASATSAATAAPAANAAAAQAEAEQELSELRKQIGELSRRMAELSLQLGDVGPQAYAFRYINESDRAMIGVVLSPRAGGPRIDAVTPDSPAERAGLRSGDILASVNGESLSAKDEHASLDKARKMLGELREGDSVRLGYRRDGDKAKEVEVKAERREAWNWQRLFVTGGDDTDPAVKIIRDRKTDVVRNVEVGVDDETNGEDTAGRRVRSGRAHEAMVEARRAMREARREMEMSHQGTLLAGADGESLPMDGMYAMMPWWGVNLATLNADLGRYFGADSGVLVLASSKGALKELKAGDVIQKVGSQAVERPEQAVRAMRDQQAGKHVELSILRDHKTMTLSVPVPEYKAIFDIRSLPAPPAPPVPPAPAAPSVPKVPGVAPVPPAPPAPSAPLPSSADEVIAGAAIF